MRRAWVHQRTRRALQRAMNAPKVLTTRISAERHERMHLTLKKETTKPAAANFLQQQAKFDDFIDIFNNQRPHEALPHEVSGRSLPALHPLLSGLARYRLSNPRQNRGRHQLRPH